LWSNEKDLVFSPFGGIGSEGYMALKCDRRFLGVELKQSYFEVGCANLAAAETSGKKQYTMDLWIEEQKVVDGK
jgi:DNA modification methylase